MNERIEELLSEVSSHGKEVFVELAQLLYMGKVDNMPPIELTQVFTDVDAFEQATV